MCRFLAYLGRPVLLEDLLITPEHSLLRQASAPRFQRHGTSNPDGFGVGWYAETTARADTTLTSPPEVPNAAGLSVGPQRYRTAAPIWADHSFSLFARQTRSTAVLGHVRSATPGLPVEESGSHPFTSGPWLFAHNGSLQGFCDGTSSALRKQVSEGRMAGVEGATDSEVLFALALDHLDAGAEPGTALTRVIATCLTIGADPSAHRLNMVLTDGVRLATTAWGDTLFVLHDAGLAQGAAIVASEPADDHPAWRQLPDRTLVEQTMTRLAIAPIAPQLETPRLRVTPSTTVRSAPQRREVR